MELDHDCCLEIFCEIVQKKGKTIIENHWDSGGAGAGSGVETLSTCFGLYWVSNEFGLSGPYDSLEEGMSQSPGQVTSATKEIFTKLSISKTLSFIQFPHGKPDNLTINRKHFFLTESGKYQRRKN